MANETIDMVVDPRTGTYRDPQDETIPPRRSEKMQAADHINNVVMWAQIKFIASLAVLMSGLWLFHYQDVRWINVAIFLGLTVYIWVAGTAPKWLVTIFGYGAFIQPGSETNRILAGSEAVRVWVTKWVPFALHAVQLSALFFIIWPFEIYFGQFAMGVTALIFVGVSVVRFDIKMGRWLANFSYWGGLLLFVAILTSTAFGFNPFTSREELQENWSRLVAGEPPAEPPAGATQPTPHAAPPVVTTVTTTRALLGHEELTRNTIGKFQPITVQSGERFGPINEYNDSCLSWFKTGIGRIEILSRPDFVSEPKVAILTERGYGVAQWGHPGSAWQVYFEARSGSITFELERKAGDLTCQQ